MTCNVCTIPHHFPGTEDDFRFNAEHARRDLGSIIQDASTLSPDDKQTVKTALMNKISTLEGSDVSSRAFVGAIGSAVAGGAASAVVGNLLSQVEKLFRRDEFNAHVNRDFANIINDASSLPPSDKQTVKTVLMNKISTLDESDVAARALAGTIGSAIAGGAASAVVGNLLGRTCFYDECSIRATTTDLTPTAEIENLFRRDEYVPCSCISFRRRTHQHCLNF